ncbi:hypothetical protein [Owenweeksia hongkongensis]|uniref:hypothetical protein n=1 Tax=Owenweeksia hongkongensis TaxID=253245 RepID=UPI003A9153E3
MKQNTVTFLLSFVFLINLNTQAQDLKGFSVDLNLIRYSEPYGLYMDYCEWSFVPGFTINYSTSNHLTYFAGLRNVNTEVKIGGIDTYEHSTSEGVEIRIGAGISTNNEKRIFISLNLEGYAEVSKLRGTYDSGPQSPGVPNEYELNHWRGYFGIAPSFSINFKLTDRIVFFADTRFRFGKMTFSGTETTSWTNTLYQDHSEWVGLYDPLNNLGFRINL